MAFEEYIMSELLVLIPVLYVAGMGLKKLERIDDRFIPIILGLFGIITATFYSFGINGASWDALFVGIVQGVLCAGASVYANQIYKQSTE